MHEKLSAFFTLGAILWTVAFLAMSEERIAIGGMFGLFVIGLVFHGLDVRERKRRRPAEKR